MILDQYGGVRLCIVNTMYVEDLQRVPGVIFDEAIQFSRHLEEVHVILFHKCGKSYKLAKNVFVHTVPVKHNKSQLFSYVLSTLLGYLLLIPLVTRVILRYKLNLVRADDILRTGVPAIIASKLTGRPTVIFVAGSIEETLKHKAYGNKVVLKSLEILERIVMGLSNHVFAVTPELIAKCRMGARSISWSPTFLDLSKFNPRKRLEPHSKLRVLYAGRLEREKGVELLVEAARLLGEENIEFMIVGDGSLRKQLERMVRTLGLSSTVRFLGAKPHHEMPEIFKDSDVFALPSFTEGIPVAMLEAVACGKPVIVTPVGIIPEIFQDRVHAFIVPVGDSQALAERIRMLKDEPKMRMALASNARVSVIEKFNSYVEQHIEAYNRVVAHSS